MKEIFKGSLIIFIFKVMGAISLFGVNILISRYYGAETLGIYNLIFALMTISTILSRVGLDMYVVRILPSLGKNKVEMGLFLKEVFKLIIIASIFVSIFLFILVKPINTYIFKSFDATNYLLILMGFIIPFTFFNVLPEVYRGFHETLRYSFFRNLSQNMIFFLLLIFSIYGEYRFDIIYLFYFATLISTLWVIIALLKYLRKKEIWLNQQKKYQKKILKYSYPMFLTSSMMFIMGYVDTFMISYYLNEYEVGIYSACMKLSLGITFILASVNGYIAPKISQAYSNNNHEEIKNIYYSSIKIILTVSAPIFLLLYLYPEFFLGLFGEEFKVATTTLLLINTAFLVNAFFGPVGIMLNMTNNQNSVMKIILISVIFNFFLNLSIIPIYGIYGAAFSTLLSMFVWNILLFFIAKLRRII